MFLHELNSTEEVYFGIYLVIQLLSLFGHRQSWTKYIGTSRKLAKFAAFSIFLKFLPPPLDKKFAAFSIFLQFPLPQLTMLHLIKSSSQFFIFYNIVTWGRGGRKLSFEIDICSKYFVQDCLWPKTKKTD